MGHGQTVIDVVSLLVRKLRGLDTAATTAMADRVEQATEAVVNAVGTPVKAPEATGALPEVAGDGPCTSLSRTALRGLRRLISSTL